MIERINQLLYDNEKILWDDITTEKVFSILRYIIGISIIILLNIYCILTSLLFPFFNFILFMIILIDLMMTIFLIYSLLNLRKYVKKNELFWKDLKRYEILAILTNKRWIQKNLSIYKFDFDKYSKLEITHYKDIILFNLELIKLIEIEEFEKHFLLKKKYIIQLFFSYNIKEPKEIRLGTGWISEQSYLKFINILKQTFNIKREEKEKKSKYYNKIYLYL